MDAHERPRLSPQGSDHGFTLVEVLIVIVIIGIVASIAVFATRAITDRGERASCRSDRDTLETAAEAYLATNGVSVIAASGVGTNRHELELVDAGFLQEASSYHSVAADGTVTTSGPPCT
jgi:prepilin-type N-terminal cleavage/methylation domain-containing protein